MENPKNQILVIFGASGDLASRKLMPALFSLRSQKLLPEKFVVIGTGRTNFTSEEFRIKMGESIPAFSEEKVDSRQVSGFTNDLYYHTMDNSNQDDFLRLRSLIEEIDRKYGIGGNCIFYMATPPL